MNKLATFKPRDSAVATILPEDEAAKIRAVQASDVETRLKELLAQTQAALAELHAKKNPDLVQHKKNLTAIPDYKPVSGYHTLAELLADYPQLAGLGVHPRLTMGEAEKLPAHLAKLAPPDDGHDAAYERAASEQEAVAKRAMESCPPERLLELQTTLKQLERIHAELSPDAPARSLQLR